MPATRKQRPAWGWVARYPWEDATEGSTMQATGCSHAESMCSSFGSWAKRRSVKLKATRTQNGDGTYTIRFVRS